MKTCADVKHSRIIIMRLLNLKADVAGVTFAEFSNKQINIMEIDVDLGRHSIHLLSEKG